MRRLQVKLLRDLGEAVVVQAIDRVEVFSKNASLYDLLKSFMSSGKDVEPKEESFDYDPEVDEDDRKVIGKPVALVGSALRKHGYYLLDEVNWNESGKIVRYAEREVRQVLWLFVDDGDQVTRVEDHLIGDNQF